MEPRLRYARLSTPALLIIPSVVNSPARGVGQAPAAQVERPPDERP